MVDTKVPRFDSTPTHWWPGPPANSECDVVMKGGITSGVIYPRAITELAKTYRLRGLGGASAGAIGAALGAAAEFGRESGGFPLLGTIPDRLDLGKVFRPQRATRQLLPIMTAVTGFTRTGVQRGTLWRWLVVVGTVIGSFWLTSLLSVLPGIAIIVLGSRTPAPAGAVLIVLGAFTIVLVWAFAIIGRLHRKLTHAVPGNMFGICTGHADPASGEEHLTDWLSLRINELAGLPVGSGPLLFGQLWTKSTDAAFRDPVDREIDLRVISTCLSRSRPYELPFTTRIFYYDPEQWKRLFGDDIMLALKNGTDRPEVEHDGRTLLAFPDAAKVPVIVATRMSLSFPLLICAVPLWTANYRKGEDGVAVTAGTPEARALDLEYEQVWFSDGGLTSNFPLYLFDSPLPSRPAFAINLGGFEDKKRSHANADERRNVVFAHNNTERILPDYTPIPDTGGKAVIAFGVAAINTARNWQDNLQLPIAGNRDRIVRVLQTKSEGGLNLQMNDEVISRLSYRGEVAAASLVDQFTTPKYPTNDPRLDGWVNQRWMRYRALLAGMPEFLSAYARGTTALGDIASDPPSLDTLTVAASAVATVVTAGLDSGAASVDDPANAAAVTNLTEAPSPISAIRRSPQL